MEHPDDPLTDDEVQALYDRANALDSRAATVALYRDWAGVYDATITRFGAYLTPDRLAGLVAARRGPDAHVLDVACGTGLVGKALERQGFQRLTGLDLSAEMLAGARAKNCYGALVTADLLGDLPFATGFDVVVCGGGFTLAHLDAAAFRRMVDLTASGGLIVADIEHHCFEENRFAALLTALAAEGRLRVLSLEPGHFYAAPEGEDWHGLFLVAERP